MTKRTSVAFIGIVGMALVFAACGSSGKSGAPTSSDNTFVLSEFTIVPPTNALQAGNVAITAKNVGGEVHELVLVRAATVEALPTKADGSIDEDKIPSADKIGEIQDVAARSEKTGTFDLTAGRYVAFCNLVDTMMGSETTVMGGTNTTMGGMGSGEGHIHFAKGMHVTFIVS